MLLIGLLAFLPYLLRVGHAWAVLPLDLSMPGPLVLVLVIMLLAREARTKAEERRADPRPAPCLAATLLCIGSGALALLLALLGWPLVAAPLLPVALGSAWWALRGQQHARRRAIVLSLLIFAPPLSVDARNLVQPPLTRLGAVIASLIATLAGLSPERNGSLVQTSEFYIEVIDSCSGFYMVLMFLIVCLTMIHLRRWRGPRAWIVVGLAAPLGLLLNGLRLAAILILGHYHPKEVIDSTLAHDSPGILLFALGVAILALIGRGARCSGRGRTGPGTADVRPDGRACPATRTGGQGRTPSRGETIRVGTCLKHGQDD